MPGFQRVEFSKFAIDCPLDPGAVSLAAGGYGQGILCLGLFAESQILSLLEIAGISRNSCCRCGEIL